MPTARYEALPAHDELDENDDADENVENQRLSYSIATLPNPTTSSHSYAAGSGSGDGPRRPKVSHRRTRSATILAKIDIANLDDKLKRWVNTLNRKFAKGKGKPSRDLGKPYEILASAFGPVEPAGTAQRIGPLKTLDHEAPISKDAVDSIVEQVKAAIRLGVHPRLNKAGSSGSYFAKSPDGKTRAIFKPKNEEPYGSLNPKWSKWLHRNLLSAFFGFGRACLVPNFSYLSEAGASLLSDRLELYIVPHTSLVSLSSPSFYYDWLDRRAYKHKKRPLPDKIGSFQLFLDGFKDASDFLRQHPWPGRAARDTLDLNGDSGRARRKKRRNWTRKCRLLCGTAGVDDDESEDEEDPDEEGYGTDIEEANGKASPPFQWTEEFMNDFRLELEKLVILDVLMRNTDRGLDNFMIKVCHGKCRSRRPSSAANLRKEAAEDKISRSQPRPQASLTVDNFDVAPELPWPDRPHVHVAAIDNSLSFPIHHPNSWRSYCYGWLFLPSSLIGQPFSQSTRDHFLPLLTNPQWWAQTVFELRQLFSQDEDFSEKMFKRQISVLKGQAWNIVMSLRDSEAGPLELCRRNPCVIHDDEETVADDALTQDMLQAAVEPRQSQYDIADTDAAPYRPSMARNLSVGGERPSTPQKHIRPDANRHSSEFVSAKRPSSRTRGLSALNGVHMSPRPIPVAKHVDLSRATFGSATGVSMIEHMERLQKQEEDVARFLYDSLPGQAADRQEEEGFMHKSLLSDTRGKSRSYRQGLSLDLERGPPISRLRSGSIDETASRRPSFTDAIRNTSVDGAAPTKIVIVERIEEVDARPFFAKW